jgi:hypothetical protein
VAVRNKVHTYLSLPLSHCHFQGKAALSSCRDGRSM